jgi:hypothetical protein
MAQRYQEAIEDYGQALDLKPDLWLARYNRAVAYRLLKQYGRALCEFDDLVRRRPNHGPLHLNRGLILQAQGKLARAITEFRTAKSLLPESTEARLCFDTAERSLKESLQKKQSVDQLAGTTIVEVATVTSADLPVARSQPGQPEPQPAVLPPRPIQETLNVLCPGCHQETSIRWNKLIPGRVLGCPHCQRSFSMTPGGDLCEVKRDSSGRWRSRDLLDSIRQDRRQRIQLATVCVAIVAVIGVSFWTVHNGQGSAVVESKLPDELHPRAELFAKAWLSGDSRTMRRLTDPARDRQLFPWYQRHAPPQKIDAALLKTDVKVDVAKLPSTPPIARVQVRIDGLKQGTEKTYELQLAWEDRGGNWIFQPDLH